MRLWPLGKVKQKRGEEMKMRALLVESDQKRRAQLWNLLRMYQVFTLAGEADTSEEAVTLLQKQKVDVVFCNHQPAPPNRTSTGDWLATVLAQNQPDIQVVMYADMGFAQFGSDLDEDTKARLAKGERIVEVLKQDKSSPLAVEKQVAILYAVVNDILMDVAVEDIQEYEAELNVFLDTDVEAVQVMDTIRSTKDLSQETNEALKKVLLRFTKDFNQKMAK